MSKVFGSKLRELRKRDKLFQKDLAWELHISQQTIADWENGKSEPTIDQIISLSKIFNVSTDFLFGLEN